MAYNVTSVPDAAEGGVPKPAGAITKSADRGRGRAPQAGINHRPRSGASYAELFACAAYFLCCCQDGNSNGTQFVNL